MDAKQVIRPMTARRADAEAAVNLSKRRAWYADDGGETDDSPETENAPKDTAQKKDSITYTAEQQAHIDKLMADQRKQGRQSGQSEFLKKLGVDKPEELEARLKKLADLEKSQLTETEQRQAELETEKTARLTAEAERDAIKAERLLERRDGSITALARDGGATVPEDVIAWAEKNAVNALKATIADDGTLDEKAVKTLIEAARKARPSWFKPTSPGSPSTRDGRAAQPGADHRVPGDKKLFSL